MHIAERKNDLRKEKFAPTMTRHRYQRTRLTGKSTISPFLPKVINRNSEQDILRHSCYLLNQIPAQNLEGRFEGHFYVKTEKKLNA